MVGRCRSGSYAGKMGGRSHRMRRGCGRVLQQMAQLAQIHTARRAAVAGKAKMNFQPVLFQFEFALLPAV